MVSESIVPALTIDALASPDPAKRSTLRPYPAIGLTEAQTMALARFGSLRSVTGDGPGWPVVRGG